MLALAACGGREDELPSGNETNPASNGQQQEQDPPDPDEGENEPDNTSAPDEGSEDEDNGVTVADCNASLDEMGITGFRFPEDLTAVECFVYMGGSAAARYCPVEQDRYEEILQSLFSDTGMTTTNAFGDTIATLDEAVGVDSSDEKPNHGFYLKTDNRTFSVTVFYYPAEYDDWGTIYEAKTLSISISEIYG